MCSGCGISQHLPSTGLQKHPSISVSPAKQNVGTSCFLQGVVPNVIYRSDSEFGGVFLFYFLLTDDLLLNN